MRPVLELHADQLIDEYRTTAVAPVVADWRASCFLAAASLTLRCRIRPASLSGQRAAISLQASCQPWDFLGVREPEPVPGRSQGWRGRRSRPAGRRGEHGARPRRSGPSRGAGPPASWTRTRSILRSPWQEEPQLTEVDGQGVNRSAHPIGDHSGARVGQVDGGQRGLDTASVLPDDPPGRAGGWFRVAGRSGQRVSRPI